MLYERLVVVLITVGIWTGWIISQRWIRKVTNCYWFWLSISVFSIVYMSVVIWGPIWAYAYRNWTELSQAWASGLDCESLYNDLASYMFLTEICHFFTFALPVCLIADPSRRAARAFAPMSALASMMVLLIAMPMQFTDTHLTAEWFFLGVTRTFTSPVISEPLVYHDGNWIDHLLNFIIATGVLFNTPRFGKKGMASVYGAIGGLYVYIIIIKFSLGMTQRTAGVSPWDVINGNFSMCGMITGGNAPAAQAVFFAFLIGTLTISIFANDFWIKRGWFKYGNVKSGTWWKYWDYEHYIDNSNQKDWGKLGKFLPKVY